MGFLGWKDFRLQKAELLGERHGLGEGGKPSLSRRTVAASF